jgi:hypothetical protein
MTFKKIVVTLLTGLMTLSAQAQTALQWVQLDKASGDGVPGAPNQAVDLFYSPQIIKKGDLATVSVLNNASMKSQSMIVEIEYDCRKNTFKLVKAVGYDGPKGTGNADPATSKDLEMFANLPATDTIGNNEPLAIASWLSGVSFGAMRAVACDSKLVPDYQKAIAAIAAAASSTKAAAEAAAEAESAKAGAIFSALNDWVKLGNNDTQIGGPYEVFYSPSTSKSGDKVTTKVLSNYLKTEQISRASSPAPVDRASTAVELEFDCKQNTYGFLRVVEYTGPKATGKPYAYSADQLPDEQKRVSIAQARPGYSIQGVPEILIAKLSGLVCTAASDSLNKPLQTSTDATTNPAPKTEGTTSAASNKSKITHIISGLGEFRKVRGFGGQYWWYAIANSDIGMNLKEVENTDKSIVLEGHGLKFTIDPAGLRLTHTIGVNRKAINIDETKSGVDLHSFTALEYDGGQLTFKEDKAGQMDVWVLMPKGGPVSQLVEIDDHFYDPIKDIDIAVDLEKRKISFDSASKKPVVKQIISFQ